MVVPAYNPGDLLTRSLSSVLTQSMADLEVVVVDDGSREPQEWVTGLDPRVTYVRQENRGVSSARNVGVAAARSDWIAFLDQDDEWLPEKLALQLDLVAANPRAAFCCTGFDWVRPEGAVHGDPARLTYRGLLSTQSALLSSMLVAREDYEAVGGHDPLLVQMQDWDLFLRLTMGGRDPVMVPDRLVRYHLHGENASRDYATAMRERLSILDRHEARARRLGDGMTLAAVDRGRSRTRELFAHQAVDAAREAGRSHDGRGVFEHGTRAGRLSPAVVATAVGQAVAARVHGRGRGSGERA
ncbi:glycosyltransferase involved in cell wall biosynthesis [Humibacillus xanthopallidus]|uniref:Glycosyltransferase involved in cell wall biosynthesis n=1 Tax=Humibacillus xanthopallidus TaxID=412689 RepID=A0A543I093_9MICO|nr:glycosyltransferase involved in cell wall biosynthesis [Humibacillus xanthopallidus]